MSRLLNGERRARADHLGYPPNSNTIQIWCYENTKLMNTFPKILKVRPPLLTSPSISH